MVFLIRLLTIGLLLTVFSITALADDNSVLDRMSKQEDLAGSRIKFSFSSLPTFRMVSSGQRVDLFFSKTVVGPKLRLLAEDDKIVRVLMAKSGEELMISLLLRKMPARISAEGETNSPTLNVDIFWEDDKGERPAIAFRIAGLPRRMENSAVSGPSTISRYSGQWRQFFERHQFPFPVDAPIRYSLPELPLLPEKLFPAGSQSLIDKMAKRDWPGIVKALEPPSVAPDKQQRRAPPQSHQLLFAEALLRTGKPKPALKIFQGFQPETLPSGLFMRAVYLHSQALAQCGDQYGAQARLTEEGTVRDPAEYRPYNELLASELALSRGNFKQAMELLQQAEKNWPTTLTDICNLRTADALVGLQQKAQALKIYRALAPESGFPESKPFSLAQAAEAAFSEKSWKEAANLYQQLADILPVDEVAGQAFFAAAIAEYHDGNHASALQRLRLVREKFPATQSNFRAWMKMLDHGILGGKESFLLQAIREYDVIAADAKARELREEAAFKLGLALYLHNEHGRAISAMEKFRREYAGGPLRIETEAFLAEILPPMIEKLIGEGQEMKAVVLVERNRELLINATSTWPFLPELAQAFSRLGLFERGCKVYLYLLERSENRPEAGQFYLPLVSLYFDRQEYDMVDQYVHRYMINFSEGPDLQALFLMRLTALSKLGQEEKAAELLKKRNRPSNDQIELIAARIFWQVGDYSQVIDCANRIGMDGDPIPAEGLLLQAEAMRRLGRSERALPLFEVLAEDGTYVDQATYRHAQILLSMGKRAEALKLFSKLAEKGEDPLWRKLAVDALDASRYTSRE